MNELDPTHHRCEDITHADMRERGIEAWGWRSAHSPLHYGTPDSLPLQEDCYS